MQKALHQAIRAIKPRILFEVIVAVFLILAILWLPKVFAYEPDLAKFMLQEPFSTSGLVNSSYPTGLWQVEEGNILTATSTGGYYSSPYAMSNPVGVGTSQQLYARTKILMGAGENNIDKISYYFKGGRQSVSIIEAAGFLVYGHYWVGDVLTAQRIFWLDRDGYSNYSIRHRTGTVNIGHSVNWRRIEFELDWQNDRFRWRITPDLPAEYGNFSSWYFFEGDSRLWTGNFFLDFNAGSGGYAGKYHAVDDIWFTGEIDWPYWFWFYDIGLSVDYPEVGSITEIPATTTTTGDWSVRENSLLYWDKIIAVVKNLATGKVITYHQVIDGYGGASGNFSIDILGLDDGNYSICWAATGRDTWWDRWAYFYCEEENRTILRVGDFPELPRYILIEEYAACEYEDCSEMALLERMVCEIKNWLLFLYCPEPDRLLDLRLTIDEMKNRFPVAYLRLVRTELNFLREEIEEKDEIEFSLFGQSGTINVNFFEEVENGGYSLSQFFHWFFGGLIALAFILYGLHFIRRIF